MHYFIYETTNNINGRKYRGAHSTKRLDDGYIGSGKLLNRAIEKHGRESFSISILKKCNSLKEMFEEEKRYVTKEWVEDRSTYNLKVGGRGGWDYVIKNGLNWSEKRRKKHSDLTRERVRSGKFGPKGPTLGFTGKKHSLESRLKISSNSRMTLSKETIENRISQWNSIDDSHGKISKMSKLWNVSHTQVRRFARKHDLI